MPSSPNATSQHYPADLRSFLQYKLTKVVTLTPRYLVRNDSSLTLNFRQYRRDAQSSGPVLPGKRFALTKLSLASSEQLSITIHHPTLVLWSAPINLADVGRVHVRVQDPTSESRREKLFRVDTQIEGSSIFLFVAEETGRWPLQIRNETDFAFRFQQTVCLNVLAVNRGSLMIVRDLRRISTHRVSPKIEPSTRYDHGRRPSMHGIRRPPQANACGWSSMIKSVSSMSWRSVCNRLSNSVRRWVDHLRFNAWTLLKVFFPLGTAFSRGRR